MGPSEDLSEYSLSVPEVAKMLGVQPMTIRRWIGDGRLPARRVPGTKPYKLRQADLDALIQGSEITSTPSGSEGMAGMDTAAMLTDPTETEVP